MALTVTNGSNPNQVIDEWVVGGRRHRRVTIAFDNSYPTGGEVLNASDVGWSVLESFVPEGPAQNAAGTQAAVVVAKPNAAKTALNFFVYNENDAAAYAQRPRLAEAQNASDQSALIVAGVLRGA